MPENAYGVASDAANWINTIDTTSYTERIKEVQEQIDTLKNQMFYVLDEIEKLKSPVHFESLLWGGYIWKKKIFQNRIFIILDLP